MSPAPTQVDLPRSTGRIALVCAMILVLATLVPKVRGQAAPQSTPQTLHATSTLVVVPALVQTPGKDLVYSLTASDFTLTDNGVPQKLSLEADTGRPLSLVVLMQIGGLARQHFADYAHLDTMLAGILGASPNKVSIVQFDSRTEYDSPFTSDLAQWADAIDRPERGDNGAAIFDGLAYALDLLKQQPPETRRAILLISQRRDDGSKTKLKDIVQTVGETNTAIYSLTFSAEKTELKQDFTNPTKPNRPASLNKGVQLGDGQQYVNYFDLTAPIALAIGAMQKNLAEEVANLSGGEASIFSNRHDLDEALNTLTNHIRNGYLLTFRPTSDVPGLHTLHLTVLNHPELTISARTNYWAAAPADTQPPATEHH